MPTLYDLSSQYQQLLAKDDYDSHDLQAIETISDTIEDKLIAISAHIQNLQAEADAVENAQKHMYERSKKIEMRIDTLKEFVKDMMNRCKIKEVTKNPYFAIKLRTNPPAVHIIDEGKVPHIYYRRHEIYKLDKELIRSDIDKGVPVPGCDLQRKVRVEIK